VRLDSRFVDRTACSPAAGGEENRTTTFVLIHGAWHGAWCWERVAPLLESNGHTVIRPDLPGRGGDATPAAETTMRSYTDSLERILGKLREPAVLVGHSFGGAVVSQATELQPDAVKLAVYVCAFLLRDGQSVWRHGFPSPRAPVRGVLVPANLIVDEAAGTLDLRREVVGEGLYHDCPAEDRRLALARWAPEPLAPLRTTLALTEQRFGRVARCYVFCTADRVIPVESQKRMCRLTPCSSVFTLASGHSPFFSMPEELARVLDSLGARGQG
jgi:pimeloyl-ACP methyl ester carboxylesterase